MGSGSAWAATATTYENVSAGTIYYAPGQEQEAWSECADAVTFYDNALRIRFPDDPNVYAYCASGGTDHVNVWERVPTGTGVVG